MGLLSEGSPLSWDETKKFADHVREHGVIQFINLYRRLRDRQGDVLKWGDEVEYMLVKFNHTEKTARVSLRAEQILDVLQENETTNPLHVKSLWRPEYGAYMVEGTPGKPYGGLLAHFNVVEANMRYRREEVEKLLKPDEMLLTTTSFPRLGCPNFTEPLAKPTPDSSASKSLFFPDEAIYPGHPRFKTLTRNIRERRGYKVAINLPIFKDKNTPSPFIENFSELGDDGEAANAALPDHVYMDAMGFGMGCCCLQLTFQACNIEEARILYDQLAPLCPILLALTAASPLHRGYVTDVDARWNVISCSVDCRTEEERGLKELKTNKFRIPKSRYDSISSYLSPHGAKYNDVPLVHDTSIYERLIEAGIDDLLAQHVAHLFIRDPVSLFQEKVHQNDEEDTDHFEVDENMLRAQKRDAVNKEKFWFRKHITTCVSPPEAASCCKTVNCDFYTELSIDEIVNGKAGEFPGLVPLITSYLTGMDVDADTHCTIQQYLKLIQRRASGDLFTTAAWIRNFIHKHPQYRHDSVVSDRINYDLLMRMAGIQKGEIPSPELLGTSVQSKTQDNIPVAVQMAEKNVDGIVENTASV